VNTIHKVDDSKQETFRGFNDWDYLGFCNDFYLGKYTGNW